MKHILAVYDVDPVYAAHRSAERTGRAPDSHRI